MPEAKFEGSAGVLRVFPNGVAQEILNSLSYKLSQHMKCYLPGKLVRGSAFRVFNWGLIPSD